MRFGCEAYFYLHSDNLFSYFLEKEAFLFCGAIFPGSSPAIRCCNRKRVARCRTTTLNLTTNCAAGNAAEVGETSPARSATSASLLWKLPTTTTPSAPRFHKELSIASASRSGRRTCGATPSCCRCPRASSRGCRSDSLPCSRHPGWRLGWPTATTPAVTTQKLPRRISISRMTQSVCRR